MATTKPRVTLTLQPDQAALLQRLSSLQGRPVSQVLADVLDVAWPTLFAVADALERAQSAQAIELDRLAGVLSRAQELASPVGELLGLLDELAGRPEGSNPRSCNHGGQVSSTSKKFHTVKQAGAPAEAQ